MRRARDLSGLNEIRDLREVQTLARVLTKLCHDRLGEAVDTIAMRVKSILLARSSKGSWDKAQHLEILPAAETNMSSAHEIALAGLPV